MNLKRILSVTALMTGVAVTAAPAFSEFKPIAPSTDNAEIVHKNIPEELNQPLNVGVFVGVRELFIEQDGTVYHITAQKDKLKIRTGKKTKTFSSYKIPGNESCIAIASDQKKLKKACYPGSFILTSKAGKITAVNQVDIEDYLRGVIPYEIGALDEERFEALKAQAVAARTYAYRHFNSRSNIGFDIYADTRDQVYKGLQDATPLTDDAIIATDGIVMTYEGSFVVAYYHSTCAGQTETEATWNRTEHPYLQSKPDLRPDGTPWCSESKYISWERSFDDYELEKTFRENAKDAKVNLIDFNSILDISIIDNFTSGRIRTLQVTTDNGSFQAYGDKIRWLFKQDGVILPSSNFTITREAGFWVLRGKGYGHGVGLCQMGARARAAAGQSYIDILTHYYPGITLEKFER